MRWRRDHSGGGGGKRSTFVFGRGADSFGLDPINVTDGESFRATRQIFDGLLRFAARLLRRSAGPGDGDTRGPKTAGRTYTLKLRDGVKFHDGTEFNAEAVKFNFDRWRDTKNPYHKGGGSNTSNFAYYVGQFGGFDDDSVIESVDVLDEYTVRFNLKEPQGPFVKNLTMSPFAIASPAAIKKNVDNFWQEPVGSGPYKFVTWERNSQVRVKANDDWWGRSLPASQGYGGPHTKQVVIKPIPDNTQRVAALTGNQLNAADGLVPDDVPSVEEQEGFAGEVPAAEHHRLPGDEQREGTFRRPEGAPGFQLRHQHTPDRRERATGTRERSPRTTCPPSCRTSTTASEPYPYDPDKAKQLLKDAGAENLKTDLWYMPIPRPYMPDAKSVAQIMQQDLQKVGVKRQARHLRVGHLPDQDGERGASDVPARVDGGQR